MRAATTTALAAVILIGNAPASMACGLFGIGCAPDVIAWPSFTPWGRRIGTVEAPLERVPRLDRSVSTKQPIAVIYDHPGRVPGSVEPYLHLESLPHVRPSRTIAAYPVGY